MKLFRSLFLFSVLGCCFHLPYAQITPISGIVNRYYKVIDIIPAKACVRVTNAAGLNYNDKVMLVQMKGASINTANSNASSFGDTTSLNNAGNYEIGTVCHVDGDSVFMVFMFLNQYTVSGKVQLVKIPQYYSATITDTLKAAAWNNTADTGGVLAIIVEEDLTLNAPIYADSSGFRGGAYRLDNSGICNNFLPADAYAYNANTLTPQDGSFKGEGVADVVAAQNGGRGAPANGGGGGNNHNNGGAGGANLSAGGDGGGNSSTVGCRVSRQGKGGKALSNYGGTKIFAGGGGGAGHSNFNFPNPTGGGHGGGIVFVQAKNLVGNNRKIAANGHRGGASLGDGASGSGAGGTIIMKITSYIGTVTIEANGAQGGTANDGGNVGRCYGAGGGGSGGAIYFSGAAPAVPVTVSGGSAGPEIARVSCNPIISAIAGSAGQIIPNYTYSSLLILESNYCAALLPVELIWFKARYTNGQTVLNWKVAQPETADRFIVERSGDGNTWIRINEQLAKDGISDYQDIDLTPGPKTNYYRLKMLDKSGVVNYSAIQKIFISSKNDLIQIYPNPASKKIMVTGNRTPLSEIFLFDLSGKLLWRKKIITNQTSMEIGLPDLSDGVYVIKIGDVVKRLVIH